MLGVPHANAGGWLVFDEDKEGPFDYLIDEDWIFYWGDPSDLRS